MTLLQISLQMIDEGKVEILCLKGRILAEHRYRMIHLLLAFNGMSRIIITPTNSSRKKDNLDYHLQI